MKIFAFGHRRYVGKDTAARFLTNHIRLEHRGLQVQKVTFATKLKDICYDLFKHIGLFPTEYYESNPSEKEKVIPELGISARELWIDFGNRMRAYYSAVWIDYAFDNVFAPIALVTDLRYIDEAEAIKTRGGVLIRIDRDSVPVYDDVADSQLANYTGWDYVINNNADLAALHTQIIGIVNKELQ